MKWLYFILVLAPFSSQDDGFIPQNISSNPCTDNNHLFLAPGVLTAGGTSRACVSRFQPDGTARMVVTVVTENQESTTAFRELPSGDGGCIDITVPQKPNTKAKLMVNLWYPDSQCTWERDMTVRIASGKVLVIHTERARYRPGDTLRARVMAFKADLTPAHGSIDEIWLEGPQSAWAGTRAAQWLRTRTRMGIAQLQHEIDELAPPGRWTLRASLGDGTQGSAAFMVGNYDLPAFQLSVRHAQRVLRTSDRLVWTVCVRYPWTEAVEGMLVIRIRGAGGTAVVQEPSGGIRTVVKIRAPRACHRHAAAARRIGLNGTNPPDVVVADFSFQEEGTRIWQNTTVVSQVVDKPIYLEFLTKHRAVISPRLPYKLKVKATRWDDKPAANEHIRVCRESTKWPQTESKWPPTESKWPTDKNSTCFEADTDEWGEARVTFTSGDDGSGYYTFHASLHNDSSIAAPPLHIAAQASGSVHAALGPIRPDTESGKTFVPLYVNLRKVVNPLTVHFVVITRGGIIYRWGATTQCPSTSSSDYIPTTSRNSQCFNANVANLDSNSKYRTNSETYGTNSAAYGPTSVNYGTNSINYGTNSVIYGTNSPAFGTNSSKFDPDSLLDRHLLRVMLPIKVTHQMCPDSHLIAYFYYNGELVSASKHFEMDECFNNKVDISWLSRQVAPGSSASLQVTTPGPALCALTVLDTAAKWSQPSPTVKDLVLTALKRLMESHRNLTEYDAAGDCLLTSEVTELPTNSLELAATWLALAGVRVIGGEVSKSHVKCVPPPATLIDDSVVPRSDFSEAWLWRLSGVGANGFTTVVGRAPDSISRFEASAVCLSRTGLAVSTPAVLQVFREFFIHADSPRRLKRGDSTIVRYRLFNYLYEPLNVQIQILADSHLQGPAEHVEAACVGARASLARRVELLAKEWGEARLNIRAKSVQDGSCGNATTARQEVSDEVIIQITIDPEGVPEQEHKSILLCGRGSQESSKSQVAWSWPTVQAVPGTESLAVWAAGDITGPLLADADALINLPRGCGEQNMARLATNLLALTQLRPDSPAAAVAKEHVHRGFTRQLQYVHTSGGFSAFGPADATPSTWLTAFCLRYLRRAHQILTPELPIPSVLERAERWLLNQQMENGCFRNIGQVFHRELKGGLNEDGEVASVALTAYTITALLDSTTPLPAKLIHNTLSCLRALPPWQTRSPARVYAQALLGYAFMRIRVYEDEIRKTNEVSQWERRGAANFGLKEDEEVRELVELLKIARRSDDYVWWETSSLSTSIEATGYGLLALSLSPKRLITSSAHDARGAARWLSSHRNTHGGFLSTQDTLVALEGLAAWSSVQPSAPTNLTVKTRSGVLSKTVSIKPEDKIPEVMMMGSGDHLDISVEGTGCALIRATRSYNRPTPAVSRSEVLRVQVSVTTDGPFDCDHNDTNCFCAAVIEACVSWAGGFPEMALLEVWLPPASAADATLLYRQLTSRDPLLRRIELTPSGSRATFYLSPRGLMPQAAHACYRVHAVGPRARTRPARTRLLDYYNPAINHTQMYTIPEDCPPRISHESKDSLTSDNLFSKAKSLSDNSEIIITHEFSFEDIPEGIPLEDPLYDAFNRDEIAYLSKPNKKINNSSTDNTLIIENNKRNASENAPLSEDSEKFKNIMQTGAEIRAEPDGVNGTKSFDTANSDTISANVNIDVKIIHNKATSYNEKFKSNDNYGAETSKNDVNHETTVRNSDINEKYVGTADRHYSKPSINGNTVVNNNADLVSNADFRRKDQNNMAINEDNPNLSNFHVIDTEGDLQVPTGVEGPIPSVVLPPPNFVPAAPTHGLIPPPTESYSRRLQNPAQNLYFFPYYQSYYHPNVHYRSGNRGRQMIQY